MNCLILDTLARNTTSMVPVWLMRQAGRYLPEYQTLKADHGFLGLCQNPELACEITLQPIRRFAPDAAILFADIMLPAECLGFDIEFSPGPVVKNAISDVAQIADIDSAAELTRVSYVFEALAMIKERLAEFTTERGRKALLGFAATPWTLACYLLDQTPYKHFAGTSIFAAKHPEQFQCLLEKLTTLTIAYCQAQIEAGADAIQLFDSWGGVLTAEDFSNISLAHTEKIIDALRPSAPVILYANGSSHLLEALASTNADALSVDWRTQLGDAAAIAPNKVIQGNLDPSLLFASSEALQQRVSTMLENAPVGRYIANLGHGVLQKTPIEQVQRFISSIQSYRF